MYPRPWEVANYVLALPPGTIVVSGAAPGVDSWALCVAEEVCGLEIDPHPADWKRYGRSAGFHRNPDIVKASDRVVVFWDGVSDGTRNTMKLAGNAGKLDEVYFGRRK
jgi:hypothetical protein